MRIVWRMKWLLLRYVFVVVMVVVYVVDGIVGFFVWIVSWWCVGYWIVWYVVFWRLKLYG